MKFPLARTEPRTGKRARGERCNAPRRKRPKTYPNNDIESLLSIAASRDDSMAWAMQFNIEESGEFKSVFPMQRPTARKGLVANALAQQLVRNRHPKSCNEVSGYLFEPSVLCRCEMPKQIRVAGML